MTVHLKEPTYVYMDGKPCRIRQITADELQYVVIDGKVWVGLRTNFEGVYALYEVTETEKDMRKQQKLF